MTPAVETNEHPPGAPRWRHVMPLALVVLVAWLGSMVVPVTANAFWPVAVAPRVLDERSVAFGADDISPLPVAGGEWVVQPWLPALVMYLAWTLGGITGLSILGGLLAMAGAAAAWLVARRWAPPLAATTAVLLVFPLLVPAVLRTELFALALAPLLLLALYGRAWWWAAPLLVAAWANLHGTFPFGVALCVGAALGLVRLPRDAPMRSAGAGRLFAWAVACTAAVFASPLGPDIVDYVRRVQQTPALSDLTPLWRGLDPMSFRAGWAILLLVLAVGGVVAAHRSRPDGSRHRPAGGWREAMPLLPVCAFAALSFEAARNVAWFALVALPDVSRFLSAVWASRALPRAVTSPLIASTLWAVLLAGVALLLPGGPLQRDFARNGLPQERLISPLGAGDTVFASIEWADYVHVRTGARVYVDARLERYRGQDLRRYLEIVDGRRPLQCEAEWSLTRKATARRVLAYGRDVRVLVDTPAGRLTRFGACG